MLAKRTDELSTAQLGQLRRMLEAAYDGDFASEDWDHSCGGTHLLILFEDAIVSHLSVVSRELIVGERELRTGYIEAVATVERYRGRGHATTLLRAAGALITERYDLGALCTGEHDFYARLGWERWRGSTFVRDGAAWTRTPDEDDAVMVLRTAASRGVALTDPISCERRTGDVW